VPGATLFFTGIFSVIFLKRRLQAFHWIGLMLCMAGAAVSGGAVVPAVSENSQNVFAAKMAMLRGKISGSDTNMMINQ